MTENTKSNIKIIVSVMLVGAFVGLIYTYAFYLSRPDPEGSIWIGISIGVLLSGFASAFEIFFINSPESKIRTLPFLVSLIIRITVHFTIIVVIILIVQKIFPFMTGRTVHLISDTPQDTIIDIGFSILILSVIIFWMQMRVFIGSRTLKNLILGKYYKPINEERIFMIVDVLGSTAATQKIGDSQFHAYLNRLFILFDQAIHKHGGEVHSYVGDAIFIMWPFEENSQKNERVFKTLYDLDQICKTKQEVIMKEFNLPPRFRAAIHGGSIAVGEMGHRKRQITYLGNTLNLTSRLEALSKSLDIPYLVSDEVLERSSLPKSMKITSLGEKDVKGSAKKLAVSQIVIEA